MSSPLRHRHRPRHHQLGPRLRGHRGRRRRRREDLPDPAGRRPGRRRGPAAVAVVPLPAGAGRAARRVRCKLPVGREPRLLRRRVRPRLRVAGADPARRLREVVAVPPRGRPQGPDPAVPRPGHRPQGVAARRLRAATSSTSPRRGTRRWRRTWPTTGSRPRTSS